MAQKRDRIFALLGAVLFLVTASTLTILVIYSAVTKDDKQPAASQSQAAVCEDNQTEPALAAPQSYKASGDVPALQTKDLEVGTGPEIKSGDCIVTKYYGTLAQKGTLFDENFTKPTGLAFKYDTGSVVPGFDEGLKGMKVGGTRRIVIPSDKGYGAQGNGAIPPNSDLVFVVKILRIQK